MPSTSHPAAVVAATASVAAGAIHAAAAGSHAELTTLSRLFAMAAVAQIGWAVVALRRVGRPVALAGAAVNGAALAAWLVTRLTGVDAIAGLEEAQGVSFPDGLAAGLAGVAVLTAVASLGSAVPVRFARAAMPAVVVVIAVAAVPAMATPHDHSGGHAHGDEVAAAQHAAGDLDGGGHAHDTGAADHADADHDPEAAHDDHADGPGHGHGAGGAEQGTGDDGATDADLGYPAAFASFLDEAPSPEARDRAEALLRETTEAMRAFPDEAAVQAAGFVSIGDGATGWEHYIHIGRIIDPAVLDPDGIESIVMKVDPDGTKEVASAMYLLPFGTTMDDAPDIAGDLTPWHDHQDLCWEGVRVVGRTGADGTCRQGEFRGTQPMLHVWVSEQPCGPFAGIEGSHGAGCAHHHDAGGGDEAAAASVRRTG